MSLLTQSLNALYRETTDHPPTLLRKDLPSEMGEGHIVQIKTKQGVSLSDWRMKYVRDVGVQGVSGSGNVQLIFCMKDGVAWEDAAREGRLTVDKGASCLYRCTDAPERICYRKGGDYHFKSLKMPVAYLCQMLGPYFEGAQMDHLMHQLRTMPTQTGITAPMEKVLHEMMGYTQDMGGLGDMHLEGKTLELFSIYLHALLSGVGAHPAFTLSVADRKALMEAKNAIDDDAAGAPRCEVLARQAGLSVTKFAKGFQSLYGMPVHTYIIDRRLEKAAALLTEHNMNVGQIAMQVGYSNASHFAAAFKRKYGISPKRYGNGQ